ncbi:hypothetical protein HMPREF9997_00789 [Corynebacterium durum F0235]|uniref:Uncharacterized protein n=1 Tax=Corynebacterium durum F0235 TaxID=1035195 RepID=L1MIW3_9CORY|nr:hypothetical protein HMPREF9997_00789 [Corynebacterium durum F0235]
MCVIWVWVIDPNQWGSNWPSRHLHHTNYADNIIDAVADGVNGDTGAGFIAVGGVKWVPSLLAVFDICF